MVKLGCLEPICNLLDSKDTRVVQLALEAIRNILHAGVPEGQVCFLNNGSQRIPNLRRSRSSIRIARLTSDCGGGVCKACINRAGNRDH